MSSIVGDNDISMDYLGLEVVDDGVIYEWRVNVFELRGYGLTSLADTRVRTRSMAKAGIGKTVRTAVQERRLRNRLTNIVSKESEGDTDFTSVYKYRVKVITGGVQ